MAGACWAEASTLAGERHTAVEAVWVQERKDKDTEIAELVTDLDKTTAEKETAAVEAAARITDLEQRLAALGAELQDARTAEQAAASQVQAASTQLAAAEARNTTLSQVHEALLERITPPAHPTRDE